MNETIISPKKSWKALLNELWEYREVFLFLGWRDILVQYRQTVIGIVWVVLRPLLTVAIFTVIFSRIARIPSSGAPYPLVVFSAMLAWQFFADTLTYGSNSFVSNVELVSKVYFPRLILPASRILCSLVDFGIAFFFYVILSLVRYQVMPTVKVFLLPVFVLWVAAFSFIISLLFASLIVRYRDFRHALPFLIQLGIYCTPVGFEFSAVPQNLQILLALNPMTGIINGFRYSLLSEPLYGVPMAVSFGVTIVSGIIAFAYFKKAEESFADLI